MGIETKIKYEAAEGFSSNSGVSFVIPGMIVQGTSSDLSQLAATTVSASSETGTNLAVNVKDGNASTFWLSGTLSGNEKITIDVKKNYEASTMVITTNNTDKIVDYQVLGSDDNITYTSIFTENGNTDAVITVPVNSAYRFYRLQVTAVTNTQVKVFSIAINGMVYNTDLTNFVIPQYIKADSIQELLEESSRDVIPATLTAGSGDFRIHTNNDQMTLRVKDVDSTFSFPLSTKVANTVSTVHNASYPTLTASNNAYSFEIDGITYTSTLTGDYSITPPTLTQLINEINTYAHTVQTGPDFDIAFDNGSGYLELRGRNLEDLALSDPSEINVLAVANSFYTAIGFTVANTSGTDVDITDVVDTINTYVNNTIEIGKVVADVFVGDLRLRDTDGNGYIALVDVANSVYASLGFAVVAPDDNFEVANASSEYDTTLMDIRYFVILNQDKDYFYSTAATDWVEVTVRGFQQASTLAELNANWGSFTELVKNSLVQIVPVLRSVDGTATPQLVSNTIIYTDNQATLVIPNQVEVNIYILDPTTNEPAENIPVTVGLVRPGVTNNGFLLLKTTKTVNTNADGLAQFLLTTTDGASVTDPLGLYIVTVPVAGSRNRFNAPSGAPIQLFL